MSTKQEDRDLNIYQKLLKIATMAGVLQKNKSGFNYKYVTEDAIQAKVTAGMEKYGVMLYPSIIPNSLEVIPYHYEKVKEKKNGNNVTTTVTPVNEIIVKCEVTYTWVNADNPEEKITCNWGYVGQMEDAAQAFGAGATYGNRYFLIKALQLATTEDDPDNYRSKQKQAELENTNFIKKEVVNLGSELMSNGIVDKKTIYDIVAKYNDGNSNPNSILDEEVANKIYEEFKKLAKGNKVKKEVKK